MKLIIVVEEEFFFRRNQHKNQHPTGIYFTHCMLTRLLEKCAFTHIIYISEMETENKRRDEQSVKTGG